MTQQTVAIIFGGKSAEFEISLKSATNIYNAVDDTRFNPILIGVTRSGKWFFNAQFNTPQTNLVDADFFAGAEEIYLSGREVRSVAGSGVVATLAAVFPIIHGTYGEDGVLQGVLKANGVPFVGPDVLGSAIAMDKDVAKRLLRDAGIPVAEWFLIRKSDPAQYSYDEIVSHLGLPVFVKPANAGSSVGVSRVTCREEYDAALATAFAFDNRVLVEEAVVGKEIECAVMGNEEPQASCVGEIVANVDFYSYDAKYISADGATLRIPADVPADVAERVRRYAVEGFKAVCCEGMARVDFLYSTGGKLVLNELNTLPGFTAISMYPQLWEECGIAKSDLITRLIDIAIERNRRDDALTITML